ncbi:MAG: OB-fold nucleic acid binding domain-containing protein [Paludibacteraceae bacterium]|nr:OB-fold nucleic acid binding domain-containing protein [Paludibacteraceae bacterium]
MKTTKYILIAVAALPFLTACENYFDEHQMDNGNYRPSDVRTSMTYLLTDDDVAAIGKQCTWKGKDTVPSVYEAKALSLCSETDSLPYTAWKRIAADKAFNDDAGADIYVPMFMAQKFPYLDAGTICNVTYPLYEGKSARQEPFRYASAYTLTEDDYRAIWGGRGAAYLTADKESGISAALKADFPLAAEGKIIVLTYDFMNVQPDTIYPPLPYECHVGELIESEEKTEHQLTGIVGKINNLLQTFYLADGADTIIVYKWNDEHKGALKNHGVKEGDCITIQGKLTFNSDGIPQIIDAKYVSHTSSPSAAPKRLTQAETPTPKTVIYQLQAGEWVVYQNEQLTAAVVLPQYVYDQLGVTAIDNPAVIIGKYLRETYQYPIAKQIYLVAYVSKSGITADEWTFDGSDFVMNTGFVYDVMSFVLNPESWVANISTYYTTPFVGDGPADFTMQAVALDGLSYIWRYQASYGMTASAYVSGANHPVEGWLVSPKIRLKKSEKPQLTFYHAVRYGNPVNNLEWLKVRVTDNYTGDVTTTTWEHLQFTDSIPDGSNWVFRNAGRFDLSKYNGETVVIAFEYNTTIGEVPSAPTWEIQDLLVAEEEEVTAFIEAGNQKRNIID